MIHTIQYDGFEVVAEAFYESPELQNNVRGGWYLESLTCTVTSMPEMIEAYGASEAALMAADLEVWFIANEYSNLPAFLEASE
tara:strand:+ start:187 stop:435 length:249 start_codon:yes stop_codon:yes gene_type:complete